MMTGSNLIDSLLIAAATLGLGLFVLPRLRSSAAGAGRPAGPRGTKVERIAPRAGRLHLVDAGGKLALFGEPDSGRLLVLHEGEGGKLLFSHRNLTALREAELLERAAPQGKEGLLGRLRMGRSGRGQVGVQLGFDAEPGLPAESLTLWLPATERQHARRVVEALRNARGTALGGTYAAETRRAGLACMVHLGGSARFGS